MKTDVVTVHNVDGGKMKHQDRQLTSSVFEVHTHYREAVLDKKICRATFTIRTSEQQATT